MKMVRLTGLPYQAPSLSAVTFDPNPALVATPTEVCISVVSSTETASSVVLKWGTLSGNLNSSLAMSNTSGNTWCATIPGQVAGNYLYQIDASIDGKVLTTGEVAYEVGDYAYSTPYGVYKSDESGSSFTMTWNRVSLSDGYKIRYRTFVGAVHGAWTTIDVGDVTTFEITSGLVSSSFYEIQIQAYGSSGVSAWSALATTFFGLGMPVPFSKLPIIFLFLLIITAVIIRKRVI